MAGTNLFFPYSSTLDVCLTDGTPQVGVNDGLVYFAKCVGAPPTTANLFGHGCLIARTDSGAGVNALYQMTGTSASPVWTLIDTALGGAATSLVDANGNTAVLIGTTASAVNNLKITDSATGAVTANAIKLQPAGGDAAISLLIEPLGVTGITTLGLSTGTGDIVLGSSSGTQTVKIGNGAGIANVSIAAVSTAGSTVNVASAATADALTDTVNIATGNTAGTGAKTVHIADGTPGGTGVNTVSIGSLGQASATTVNAGTGNLLLQAAGTGTVTVGKSDATGDVVLGSSSATQSVKIGNGAGVSTVNIANATTATANVNIATTVPTGVFTNSIVIGGGANGGGIYSSTVSLKSKVTAGQSVNYIATESGVDYAIVGSLADANATPVPQIAGLQVRITLAHALRAGANTFAYNGNAALAIKSHFNPASDIVTAYVSGGVVDLFLTGSVWLDMSQ